MREKLTLAEAEAKIAEYEETGPDWFCPLLKDTCNTDCICYVPADKQELPDKYSDEPTYKVIPHRCCNKLLGG